MLSRHRGPSSATRTRGFHIPNVAPYQLGYTRIYEIREKQDDSRSGQICGQKWICGGFAKSVERDLPSVATGFAVAILAGSGVSASSQMWRPTNWAIPGFMKLGKNRIVREVVK